MGIATDMELINYWPYHSLDNFLKDFDGFQTPKERLKNKGNRRKEMERKGRKRKGLSNKASKYMEQKLQYEKKQTHLDMAGEL